MFKSLNTKQLKRLLHLRLHAKNLNAWNLINAKNNRRLEQHRQAFWDMWINEYNQRRVIIDHQIAKIESELK